LITHDLLNIGRITIENSKRSYRKMKAEWWNGIEPSI